jgi:hypothetical protein
MILPVVLKPAAKFCTVAVLILWIGGHWAFVQAFAWASMAVSFSQETSITQALEWTFDGAHPCHLCKFVNQSRQSESKQQQEKGNLPLKIEFVSQLTDPVLWYPISQLPSAPLRVYYSSEGSPPPVPPPLLLS